MYVFHFARGSHVYIGSDPCEFDQLEPGRVIVPAWATSKPPPKAQEGKERVFNMQTDEWELRDIGSGDGH